MTLAKCALVSSLVLGLVGCADSEGPPGPDAGLATGGSAGSSTGGSAGAATGGAAGSDGSAGSGGGIVCGDGGIDAATDGSTEGGTEAGTCAGGAGTPCCLSTDCCQLDVKGDVCVREPINQCAAICTKSSDCSGNCCVQLSNLSYGACLTNSPYPCLP